MSTSFYWHTPNNHSDWIDDAEEREQVLRQAIHETIAAIEADPTGAHVSHLKEIYRITGPRPEAVDVTLPTGVVVPSDIALDDPRIHIGKRSAAGWYCFDCDVTLCPGGKDRVHMGEDEPWHRVCPQCGQDKTSDSVRVACSFTWAQDPATVLRLCKGRGDHIIVDEYDRSFTGEEFVNEIIGRIPIQFTDHVGQAFS